MPFSRDGTATRTSEGQKRLYNPLPLCHVNASLLSCFCMLLTGNCQVQTDRFAPSRLCAEVRESRASIVHYLGVVIPMRLVDSMAPRQVGTRAFGRAVPGVQARVVDAAGVELADGTAGELVIRHSAEAPRKGFFSGHLADPAATEDAWCGGWRHTGDIVTREAPGMLHFDDSIATTGAQKFRKHAIFAKHAAARTLAGRVDLCALGKR